VFSFASIQFLTVSVATPSVIRGIADLIVRYFKVVLSCTALCSARGHDQSFRRVYPNVECTQNLTWAFWSALRVDDDSQPYLLLSRGHASADETLLLDYVS
jgi:hypothetical protein